MIACLFILCAGFVMTCNYCKGRSDIKFIHLKREMYRVATNAAPTFDVVMITEQQQPTKAFTRCSLIRSAEKFRSPAWVVRTECAVWPLLFDCRSNGFLIAVFQSSHSTSVTVLFRDGPNDGSHW